MTIRNLQFLFRSASVALVGTGDHSTSGAALLHNLYGGGFTGEILLASREARTLQGKPTYRKLSRLPHAPELAIIATTPETVPALIAELSALGTKAAVLIDPVPVDVWPEQRQALLEAARPYLLRLAGPTCHAVLAPGWGINIGFSPVQPRPGPIAFVTQSGAIAMAVLDWAYPRGIGFSQVIALIAQAVIATVARYQAQGARKPCVFTSWLGGSSVQAARRLLSARGIPSYDTPVEVVRAILNRVQYRRNQDTLMQTPPA